MSDQPVYINNGITLKQITYTTPTAPTLALHAGTSMGIGSYTYAISFGESNGLSVPGTTAAITTTTGNQQVSLTAIPTGPTGTNYRNIYRSKVGTTSPLYYVASLGNNTTTIFLDTVADASLGGGAPPHDYFGGYLQIVNQAGTIIATLFNDGYTSGIRGITTLLSPPYSVLNNTTLTGGVTNTYTVTGVGNIPSGTTAVFLNVEYTATSGAWLEFVPHSTTFAFGLYPMLGSGTSTGGFITGSFFMLLDANGKFDVIQGGNTCTGVSIGVTAYVF